jgi:hypothetical protein
MFTLHVVGIDEYQPYKLFEAKTIKRNMLEVVVASFEIFLEGLREI